MDLVQIKKYFLDFISFGTPQARVINLTGILVLLAVFPTSSLSYSPFKCLFKNLILPFIFQGNCPASGLFANCECPACGMTRALSSLLHGNITAAWNFNPLVFVLAAVMVVLIGINLREWVRKHKKTGRVF